ncbi:uncharacterized protein TRUGW13939_09540 [Talaromyces rugulosus]|uniref:RecA family profile 1 domain-containing protein n=1 Tax=Talaromyces rugulosus TaxID=121627 RepID=A0A7H8R9G8_TALRU|nr:uncharacterized protein TRUGW13939_09540 [Talaromyces rugulosus]QKX62381.1 hypothetical protein TRUGW13939_09540 [Talaromyces rugulosus]
MDLLSVLPDFSTKSYTHILPPLERKHISTVDLITLDTLEIAKRAHVPPADVRRLSADVVVALHASLGWRTHKETETETETEAERTNRNQLDLSRWNTISTLDATLDELLGGGIPTGYLTEITGESGSGKTQFLLNLLLAAQLAPPHGIGKTAIYISTEAPLSTRRLSQLLQKHPYLSNLEKKPSLGNVLSITAVDLETQDHILNYQLPVAISRFNVGLVVIDSITANYRAEHASNSMQALSARSGELAKLGHMLRNLAASEDVAIVVANQVSDRFDSLDGQQQQQQQGRLLSTPNRSLPKNRLVEDMPSSSPATQSSQLVEDDAFDGGYLIGHPVRNETLTLAYQEKFFTGWGDDNNSGVSDYFVSEVQKTPALGLVWSTQIACRIVLKKDDETDQDRVAAAAAAFASSQPVQPVHSGISTARNIPSPLNNSHNSPSKEPQKGETDKKEATPREPSLSQPAPSTSTPTSTSTTAPATATSNTKRKVKRRMKLVFAPWASGIVKDPVDDRNNSDEVEFEIWEGGIKSVARDEVGNV